VRIYKSRDTSNDRYENAWHCDATWREKPPFGCVLRCVPAHRRRSERADPRSGLCSGSSWQYVARRHHWRNIVLIIGKSPLIPN
jgi:alpha-ketoglutarate-dependent taurine dioxygenase